MSPKFILFVALNFVSFILRSQDITSQTILKYDSLTQSRPNQSIYLQLNKGIYETGEDLWFKGYILDARYLTPSNNDTTLYVQLRHTETNKLILQEKYLIKNGFTDSHLILSDTLAAGNYMLLAFSKDSFLDDKNEFKAFRKIKVLKRINPETNYTLKKVSAPSGVPVAPKIRDSIMFFPESGHIVLGQLNTIAFKSVSHDGKPLQTKAELLENGKMITKLESTFLGMGKFYFTPLPGKYYSIRMAGSITNYPLPDISSSGYILRKVRESDPYITFLVTKTNTIADKEVIISAQVRGVMYGIYKAVITGDSLHFNLPKHKFPQGIVEVTLYNSGMLPLAERLVYINSQQKINIQTVLTKSSFGRKEKVTLNIKASNEKGEPVIAHLGLSAFDGLYKNPIDFMNILSYMQLNLQLKGQITNPDNYFDENNKDREAHLDLLLMTQGWRKYVWGRHELAQAKPGKKALDDDVKGSTQSKQALPTMLLAITPEQTGSINTIPVLEKGDFIVSKDEMQLAKQGYIYIKPLGDDQTVKNAKIGLSDPFASINSLLIKKNLVSPAVIKAQPIDTLTILPNIPGLINLKEVAIKGKSKTPVMVYRDKYLAKLDSTAKFAGNFDFVGVCKWLNCGSCGSGTRPVEGVAYAKYKDGRVSYHGAFKSSDIVQEPYKYPQYTEEQLLALFNIHRVQGYTAEKVFYIPDYEQKPEEKDILDFRNTLIWNPNIITDTKGEAKITFYTSDITGKFIGNIEGVDGTGRLGQSSFNFKVN